MKKAINILGIREHNFNNQNVSIPHNKHTVLVGVSGSGKSTLAYDVIYAAGQKRLLDCLSDQVKRYAKQVKQPDIDYIDGLTPVISFKQHKPNINPRSTVGTMTDISSYIRTLFSINGVSKCFYCNKSYSISQLHYVVKELESLPEETIVEVQFPYYLCKERNYDDQLSELKEKGYRWIYVGDDRKSLRDWINIDEEQTFILVVAGSLSTSKELTKSSINLLQNAVKNGDGFIKLSVPNLSNCKEYKELCNENSCLTHQMFTVDIKPSFFSFNDFSSCCSDCKGSGIKKIAHPITLVQNENKSLREGPFFRQVYNNKQPYWFMMMYSMCEYFDFSFDEPFKNLPDSVKNLIFYGCGNERFPLIRPEGYDKELPHYTAKVGEKVGFEGLIPRINAEYRKRLNQQLTSAQEEFFKKFMIDTVCPVCNGSRLKPSREYVTLEGVTYDELGNMEFSELLIFLDHIKIVSEKEKSLRPVINELKLRLSWLVDIGLGYLSYNRRIDTLSGGEYQRLRLAGQLCSGLMGLTYIIDEPLDGLHGSDNEKIIRILNRLKEQGNTIITIEHDLDIIKCADYIIEVGPGPGKFGGYIIAKGTPEEIITNNSSVLRNVMQNSKLQLKELRFITSQSIKVYGAKANNLKNIDVEIPLNQVVCVTGVSGSGKSTLAIEILYKLFMSKLHDARIIPGSYDSVEGMTFIEDIYCIDQSALNRTKSSIPATYIGVFDAIRDVFAKCENAVKLNVIDPAYFSFNSKGGCPSCKGKGYLDKHVHYFGDLQMLCPLCEGNRYINDVLEVTYKGKNIAQVLQMDIESACTFFEEHSYIHNKLNYMLDLGLGYMSLGQPVNTVSNGEAQRLRLAKELSRNKRKKNLLYILDEPTAGLHAKDVKKILNVIRDIVDKGNTVVVIEHNPEVIINSDYVIDMGPGAGKEGGRIVFTGTPSELLQFNASKTSDYLKRYYYS